MQHQAFAAPGDFFKGNLHTHSTRSDGALDPAEVCRRYAEAGYDFISLTDHFLGRFGYPVTDTRAFRTNRFTTIPGAEIHADTLANGELWHMVAVGLPDDFAPPDVHDWDPRETLEPAPAFAARARDAGAFVALAHPEWFGMTVGDARAIEAAHAVEIYNHGCEVQQDRGGGFAILDALLSEGRRLSGCATDDAHFKGRDHFGGWVMVKAEANEPQALLEALKAGAYYSSTGPELHEVAVDGDALVVECSPVRDILAVGHGSASTFAEDESGGPGLTSARLPLAPFVKGGWVRATAVDAEGRKAWSNPLWLG
ncbi:MAG TPA: CehA/McbA family metallohydrolase [Thermohalobaculum sp.]|nr:CehA/McbA family metallohydrolase [Thermohalobaculum sp.]